MTLMKRFSLCLLIVFFALVTLVEAAPEAPTPSEEPVKISADLLEADDLAQTLVFIGNAVAEQGDVTIYGDRLTLKYTAGKREVAQVLAEGHVRIVQGARVATSQKAILFHAEERIVLTGSPKVSEGENFIQGQEITLYLNDQRSVVSGGDGGRVNAVFTPKSEAP